MSQSEKIDKAFDNLVERTTKRKRKVVPVNRELPHRLQKEVEADIRERFF